MKSYSWLPHTRWARSVTRSSWWGRLTRRRTGRAARSYSSTTCRGRTTGSPAQRARCSTWSRWCGSTNPATTRPLSCTAGQSSGPNSSSRPLGFRPSLLCCADRKLGPAPKTRLDVFWASSQFHTGHKTRNEIQQLPLIILLIFVKMPRFRGERFGVKWFFSAHCWQIRRDSWLVTNTNTLVCLHKSQLPFLPAQHSFTTSCRLLLSRPHLDKHLFDLRKTVTGLWLCPDFGSIGPCSCVGAVAICDSIPNRMLLHFALNTSPRLCFQCWMWQNWDNMCNRLLMELAQNGSKYFVSLHPWYKKGCFGRSSSSPFSKFHGILSAKPNSQHPLNDMWKIVTDCLQSWLRTVRSNKRIKPDVCHQRGCKYFSCTNFQLRLQIFTSDEHESETFNAQVSNILSFSETHCQI